MIAITILSVFSSANQTMEKAIQSANETGEDVAEVGSKVTEGAKDLIGTIGDKLQDLAKLAKIYKMPVVLTTSYEEGPNGPIAPGLKEMFPDVEIIKRQGEINAWDDPNFVKAVEATGRKKLIISGILTDVCVAFPTLSAIEAGYDVVAAIDGSGTLNQTVREAAISRMVHAGAQIMTWFPIMAELQGDWKKSTAPDMVRLLIEHAVKYGLIVSSYVANKPDQTIVPKDFKA